MTFVFILILIAVIIASFVAFRKAKALENQQQLPSGYGNQGFTPANRQLDTDDVHRTMMSLQINDIVSYFGDDYIVDGRLDFWEDGYTWVTYMLVDGDQVKWLSAEEDDQLEVTLWEEVDDIVLNDAPEFIEYRGMNFRMTERGSARVTQKGRTKNKTGLNVEYFEYEAQGDEWLLSVERYSGSYEVSFGKQIRPEALEILPGDQVEY